MNSKILSASTQAQGFIGGGGCDQHEQASKGQHGARKKKRGVFHSLNSGAGTPGRKSPDSARQQRHRRVGCAVRGIRRKWEDARGARSRPEEGCARSALEGFR
jgi:hypothetical protein